MRRSSKASQIISQSGQDEIYKFRCMQYLNFVLDQVVNDDTKFKLYTSHIESLLRNNLNDITIQDIEKIKRMIQEGEKQKVDSQQTGQFINYDLIEKQKYSLKQTHYYLQQAPNQALIHLYGHNSCTLNEVQLIKNQNRIECLQQKNYKMLDTMFKLPEDYKIIEEQLQKRYEKQNAQHQPKHIEFVFQNLLTEKEKVSEILKPIEHIEFSIQNHVINSQNTNVQEIVNKTEKKAEQKHVFVTPQKSKQKSVQQPVDISFVEIKKKPKKKKTQTTALQKKVSIVSSQPLNEDVSKPQVQSEIKQNVEIEEINQNKNEGQQKASSQSPQKRKYIRKKPLEPRKPKEKPVSKQIKQVNVEENKIQGLPILQQSNQVINVSKQILNIIPALIAENRAQVQQQKQQMQQIQEKLDIKEKQQKVPLPEKSIKDLIKKQSKPKKPKKPVTQLQKSESKKSKKANNNNDNKQIQIVLPYPDCQIQCDRLKKQVQILHQKIQAEKQGFQENRQQALNILTLVHIKQAQKPQFEDVQKVIPAAKDPILFEQEPKIIDAQEIKLKDDPIVVQQHAKQQKPQPQQVKQIKQVKSAPIIQKSKQKISKKLKQAAKLAASKKVNKKQSSEEYKPLQDQLQSIQESENNQDLKQGDFYQPGKQKKLKKKIAKKKIKKQNSKTQKSRQRIQRSHTEEQNTIRPSQSLISNDTESKQKKLKLTPEQREKIKIQRQKLKEMRLIQKQERKKLKELEKLQKQGLKLKKIQKSQQSSKSQKLSSKHRNNSISAGNESSSLWGVLGSTEEKKPSSPTKKLQNISLLKAKVLSQKQKQKNQNKKVTLDSSMCNNSSTREDINRTLNSVSIQKSLFHLDNNNLQAIRQSQQKQKQMNKERSEGQIQNELEFVTIEPVKLMDSLDDNIFAWEHNDAGQLPIAGPKREKSSYDEINELQKSHYDQQPKKKIKLTPKQSQVFQDPQYGIEHSQQPKQLYKIQVFESNQVQQNEQNEHHQQNGQDNQANEEEEEQFSVNSSSLSADDD